MLTRVLEEEPVGALGQACWAVLLENSKLFEEELAACRASLANIVWETQGAESVSTNLQCSECGSALVKQLDPENQNQQLTELMCSACGELLEMAPLMVAAIGEANAAKAYIAVKDGGEDPVGTCPECGEEAYVFDEGGCAVCGFEMPGDATCAVCGESLTLEDYEESDELCSYHRWQAQKDD